MTEKRFDIERSETQKEILLLSEIYSTICKIPLVNILRKRKGNGNTLPLVIDPSKKRI